MDDFKEFYEQKLLPDLQELEGERLQIKAKSKKVLIWLLSVLSIISVLLIYLGEPKLIIFLGAISTIPYFLVQKKYAKSYKKDFKSRIIPLVIKFVDGNLTFNALKGIEEQEIGKSRLFYKAYDRSSMEDLVQGNYQGQPIQFSEVTLEYHLKKRSEYKTIFQGIFFVCDFNKHFATDLHIYTHVGKILFGEWAESSKDPFGDIVTLEDPTFQENFSVYGKDQVEARYILSTSFMQRLMDFFKKVQSPIHISFVDSKMYLAINTNQDLFEARISKTILDVDFIKSHLDSFILFTGIIEDLNLNRRIWGKE